MRNRQIHAVRISIADPKQIEKWGKEVTRPETINYRTGLPEPDGLFCEKIFGPTKNFECYCGKFKNVRREGLVCDVCGVTVTHSRVRRRWMGTIRLAVPVVHPWFLNIQPGVIQTILALTKRALKQIVYYMKYAVTFVDVAKKERLLQRRPDAPEYTERLQELEEVSREDLLERLNHYVGPLRDWAESEIQLQLSRTSRPGYNRTVKPREYLFSIAGRQEVLSPVVDEVTGEVLMELRDQLDYRAITRLVESGLDLRKLMVKVGKTGRTLEKSISQRLTLEEIVADVESTDGHVVAAAGTSLRDVFWDLLVENRPVLLANVRDKEQFEDIQGRVVRDIAQIIDGLDAFHRLEGYVPLDGGSSTDGFIVSGAEKRNLDRISKIIVKRGDLAARDVFRVATGGSAIHELLRAFEIRPVVEGLEAKVAKVPKTQQRPIRTRLQVLKGFLRSGQYGMDRSNRLEWMVLRTLPVIPPDLRPIVSLEGGRQATSDINELYHRVITRNNRLRHMEKILAPEVIVNNERRLLQQSVDALIDNSRRERPDVDPNGRPFESLSDTLRGKKGRFRQNLLGKRVDYSARAVIVAGPRLKLWQCGLPKTIALELFKPKLIHLLQEEGLAEHVMDAIALIDDLYRQDERTRRKVWDLLSGLVSTSVILLNRAPTLHRLGIQAFEPTLTDEHAIRLHPLVCTPFNADFDGDQMAVHLPLSEGAQAEARLLVMSTNNLYVPGTGVPAHLPSQDIVLGLAYMTSTPPDMVSITRANGRGAAKMAAGMVGSIVTADITDAAGKKVAQKWDLVDKAVIKALAKAAPASSGWEVPISKVRSTYMSPRELEDIYYSGVAVGDGGGPLRMRDVVGVRMSSEDGARLRFTTVGRSIFNRILPPGLDFVDHMVQKKELLRLIHEVLATRPQHETITFLDDVKRLGFRQCTLAGISLSVSDIVIPEKKAGVVARAERLEGRVDRAFETGEIDAKFAGHLNQRLGTNLLFASKNPKTGEEVLVRPKEKGRPTKREWNDIDERWSDGTCPEFGHALAPAEFDREMYEKVIEGLWDRATSKITSLLVEAAAVDNPLMLMVNSGARGAMDQIRQLAGLRGLMRDPAGKLILVPIKSNFKEGLSVHEYFSSTHGARKGQTDTALRTSRSGYLTRRLVDIAQGVYAAGDDCKTIRSIGKRPFEEKDGGWEWDTFAWRLLGRTVAEDFSGPKGQIVAKRTVMDKEVARLVAAEVERRCVEAASGGDTTAEIRRKAIDEVRVFSPITCEQPDGICRVCYGISMASRTLVVNGDPVGVMAAQSIGEPGTQLTMRTFHTGGAAGADVADITQGLPLAEIFFECYQSRFETRPDSEGAVLASVSGSIRAIVPGKADDKYIAEITIFHGPKSKDITKIKVATGRRLLVRVGDVVVAGEPLTTGLRSPAVLLAMQGRDAVQRYVMDTIQGVYRSQGVDIADVHFEVIIREMLRYVRVVDPGDSYMQGGQEMPAAEVNGVNRQLERQGRKPILWEPIIVGLKRGAVMSPSFLSAASFQQTAKALLNAAIQGKVDFLQGLKENVIVGERIPVGTGYRPLLDVTYDVEGPPMGAGLDPEATETA